MQILKARLGHRIYETRYCRLVYQWDTNLLFTGADVAIHLERGDFRRLSSGPSFLSHKVGYKGKSKTVDSHQSVM